MKWYRRPEVVWRAIPGYLALGSAEGDVMEAYGVAADVWDLLAQPRDKSDLIAELVKRYGVDGSAVDHQVDALLLELGVKGYVQQRDC